MQEKQLLINSMQKLINHIILSKKNQEEIFASLSRNDFKKIIANLEDQNVRLRKISLSLITQLLYNNTALKEKFCQMVNIPLVPGRIALSTKLSASSNTNTGTSASVMNTSTGTNYPRGNSSNSTSKSNQINTSFTTANKSISSDTTKNIREVYSLLKHPISQQQRNSLFWFINYDTTSNINASSLSSASSNNNNNNLSLHVSSYSRSGIGNTGNNNIGGSQENGLRLEYYTVNGNHIQNVFDIMDPINSMIGFILPSSSTSQQSTNNNLTDRPTISSNYKRNNNINQNNVTLDLSSHHLQTKRNKSQYESISNTPKMMVNNYLMRPNYITPNNTNGKTIELKATTPSSHGLVNNHLNSSFNNNANQINLSNNIPSTSGYVTDREMHYVPNKHSYVQQNRVGNFSMYQDSHFYGKNNNNQLNNSVHHGRAQETRQRQKEKQRERERQRQRQREKDKERQKERARYAGGIKLYTNPATTKNRDQKYFQESLNLHSGSVTTSNMNKTIEFPQQNPTQQLHLINRSYKERGYQTLREKHLIEKYPY